MEAGGFDNESLDPITKRACDRCRVRKIRCDKQSPCFACRSAKVSCLHTKPDQKSRKVRRRILVSDQYDKKIESIENRLAGMEQTLQYLKPENSSNVSIENPLSNQHSSSASDGSAIRASALIQCQGDPMFEGNSSLAAHSAYASDFLEAAVSRNSLQMSAPNMDKALSMLKKMVNSQGVQAQPSFHELQLPDQKHISRFELRDLTMPPAQVVLPLLRKLKDRPPSFLLGYFPFLTVERVIEKCRDVYFPTEDYTDATFIIVNGALLYIFLEDICMSGERSTQDAYKKYAGLCRTNLQTTLAHLNLIMPLRMDSIEALTIAAVHTIEISKPLFSLMLISAASQLCQTLGYHRASSMIDDDPSMKETKCRLFWVVYCTDKFLCLRLGRPSTIQDYNISLPRRIDKLGDIEPWCSVYPLWIDLCNIHGRVYELLYSPTALRKPEAERSFHARQLASEMEVNIIEPLNKLEIDTMENGLYDELYIKSNQVGCLAVLTLIYRAIPPAADAKTAFVEECVSAARLALELHQACMQVLRGCSNGAEDVVSMYLHWTILCSPFIPFIVVFCRVIECCDPGDLKRLDDFVTSLESNCVLSEGIAKMHHLFQLLSNVARLYVEAKAKAETEENDDMASVSQEIDSFLNALGLASAAPLANTNHGSYETVSLLGSEGRNAAQGGAVQGVSPTEFGNWFSGDQYMMNLLAQDFPFM